MSPKLDSESGIGTKNLKNLVKSPKLDHNQVQNPSFTKIPKTSLMQQQK